MPRRDTAQVGLFDLQEAQIEANEKEKAAAAQAAAREANRDVLGEQLVAKGWVQNEFLLQLNGVHPPEKLQLEYPWNLPSRMMSFPIHTRREAGQLREFWIDSPLLLEHPAVVRFREEFGFTLGVPPWGREYSTWHHAVDLVSRGMWKELLATRAFSGREQIEAAVGYGQEYGSGKTPHISPADARTVLLAVGGEEPDAATSRATLEAPQPVQYEKSETWPVRRKSTKGAEWAWAIIHAKEAGWIENDRNGFLRWSVEGRRRYEKETGRTGGAQAQAPEDAKRSGHRADPGQASGSRQAAQAAGKGAGQ